jgi:hypothetical protein
VNSAAANGVTMFLLHTDFIPFGYMDPLAGLLVQEVVLFFNFWRNFHTVAHNGYFSNSAFLNTIIEAFFDHCPGRFVTQNIVCCTLEVITSNDLRLFHQASRSARIF